MSNKETKSFEKFKLELKQFFRGNKSTSGPIVGKQKDELFLTAEIENEISVGVPIEQRIKAIKGFSEIVLHNKLEEHAVEKLCGFTKDILLGPYLKDHRHAVFIFYQSLVQGQYDRLGSMRTFFFKIIKAHELREDTIPRLELFQKLTENGKVISSFEEEVGPFLLSWMPVVVASGKSLEFLLILVNYIKYNAAYIDDDIISGIVQNTSYLCCQSDVDHVVKASLEVLDTIVCYSNISQQTMGVFISALSRTVCLELYNTTSWKITRNLLGTHMGHFCLQTMCKMLQEEKSYSDIGLVSGVIFNLNMAILNNKPDFIIGYIPTFIIPSISKAAHYDDPVILIEVCLCIKCLIEKFGKDLKDPLWDRIFVILETLITKLEQPNQRAHQCQLDIHDIFNKINLLLESNQFQGDVDKLFQLTHRWHPIMPEPLIYRLIDYSAKSVIPIEPNWIGNLQLLLSSFFIKETRTSIRTKVLNVFFDILKQTRFHHEKELINNIVTPYFNNIASDKDDVVRNAVIKHLLELCSLCKSSYMESILDILEKVLKLPYETEEIIIRNENDCVDVKTILKGLVDIFIVSIYQLPSSNCIRILCILTSSLQNHYKKPHIFEPFIDIRWMVIDCLLKLRSDSKYRLGFSDESKNLKFSPYLIVDYRRTSNISLSAVSSIDSKSSTCSSFEEDFVSNEMTYISLSNACQVVVTALKCELDWRLLHRILQAIPTALKNKALILSRYTSDVEHLIKALISMISEGFLPEGLKNTPLKFTKPDFYSHVIPVLSSFASYHTHLEFNQQQRLIICLQHGLVHKSAPQCVTALMTCLLEMKEAMVKLLPDVLLNLSKISATVHVAIPTLEFLSMLTTFPKVFANFTPNQYMSIFAIIFPYTNPFKYHHYTVSLAHHVIAVWFLKCRKPFRQEFVKYIISGLRTNVLSSFEDGHFIKNDILNEDSSTRKRSSSLTEQGNKRKERHMSGSGRLLSPRGVGGICDMKKEKDETLTFHRELTDTCIDLMSRVAFTSCSSLPKRHPSSDFVLHNGQSMTWLLGNKLITVTTSGCSQKPIRNGLCDRCSSYCVIEKDYNRSSQLNEETNSEVNDKDKQDSEATFLANSENASAQNSLYGSNSVNSSMNSSLNISSGGDEKKMNECVDMNKQHYSDEFDAQDQCVCWCQGWAEIHIRRPTGDISWIMRIQNETNSFVNSDPMIDMSTLYQPSIIEQGMKMQDFDSKLNTDGNYKEKGANVGVFPIPLCESSVASVDFSPQCPSDTPETLSSNTKIEKESVKDVAQCITAPISYISNYDVPIDENLDPSQDETINDQYCHGRNPVRRSNSSPEMSSNWKNTCLKDSSRSFNTSPVNEFEQGPSSEMSYPGCRPLIKCHPKEMRGNCEAIPEEFSGQGTTPPKAGGIHISLIPDKEENIDESSIFGQSSETSKSPCPKLTTSNILPSFSYEDVNPKLEEKKMENKFFDKQSLPNDHFEFNRSASVSQVVPPSKKLPPISACTNLSHSLASSQPHLTTKPPLSPPTYSSRVMNRHLKDSSPESRSDSFSQLNQDYKRYRFNTISVMSPTKKSQSEFDLPKSRVFRPSEQKKSGVNPCFVFLQLYDSSQFSNSNERPFLVPSTREIQRAINIFDLIPPYETHKVGVIYVGSGQTNNETEILRNAHGSTRYAEFLSKLGTLVNLSEVNPQNIFLGGLEQNGNDGKFAYIWKDDVMQVIFHVATLMPNQENDLNCNNKKKHIGNDYVTIVYNESEEEYDLHTVKCQFNFACVIIEPLDHGSNQLTIKTRDDLKNLIGHVDKKIVSDKNVSLLARQLALHINLASVILCSLNKDKNYAGIYASNWLERLRKIKHIKNKVFDELKISSNTNENPNKTNSRRNYMCDFTEYTS